MTPLKIGTRESPLAMWQAGHIASRLKSHLGQTPQLVPITTQGDRVTDRPLSQLSGQGFFTKELEEALLANKIDLAVHSFKDMPSKAPAGLSVAAVTTRDDPADLLLIAKASLNVSSPIAPIRLGAVIGTSAVRRKQQLFALRPDLQFNDLRGNVATRLNKLRQGKYDAIFLASAGANRLGLSLEDLEVFRFDPREFVPAPGQGALAVQMCSSHPSFSLVHEILHDAQVFEATQIERSVQHHFGGGCSLPLGAYATQDASDQIAGSQNATQWTVYGFWGGKSPTGIWHQVSGTEVATLGPRLYELLSNA